MADPHVTEVLNAGVEVWNSWRRTKKRRPDLSYASFSEVDLGGADLSEADLSRADLRGADLTTANLSGTDLSRADLTESLLGRANLSGADLTEALLRGADLREADISTANLKGAYLSRALLNDALLIGADLSGADLSNASLGSANLSNATFRAAYLHKADLNRANLSKADFTEADLTEVDLTQAVLVGTRLTKADLSGSCVYGLSAWDVLVDDTIQSNLIITPDEVPIITLDSLALTQFIYLLLSDRNIRHVIDTITSKVVLILGRFTPERKAILDAIRDELRKRDYLPVLFDFEKPSSRDITETVSTLAHMARFVIADITDAKSIPQELMAIVPSLPSVPVQPLLLESQREYGMFEHFRRYPWVLEPYLYDDQDRLLAALNEKVIGPAAAKAREQTGRPKP